VIGHTLGRPTLQHSANVIERKTNMTHFTSAYLLSFSTGPHDDDGPDSENEKFGPYDDDGGEGEDQ
jgi:hypothetical protein